MDEVSIIDNWSKERILGSGAFGVVTLWKNNVTEEVIAIKKCKSGIESLITKKYKERWCQEVEMMKSIDHVNIVSYKNLPDILENALAPYNLSKLPMLSMEYCAGGDLRETLNRSANCCGLPEAVVRDILFDVKNAIEYLHSKTITHRDLKPENIVLQQAFDRPSKFIYKLTDLGYAKELDSNSLDASLVGTIQYLAPEILCAKSYSNSVDYWSFGLIAFEIICGVRPFLPNYVELGIWMDKVKQKQSEHICIFNTIDNQIIYSEQMYSWNHVTKTFKSEIEKWLKVALEWNPKKRGRNSENNLIIFSMLDDILIKKILSIYSVNSYQFLSYEIDDSTLIATLQGWIERDTSLMKADQFILDFYGEQILSNGMCKDYFDEAYNSPMLYVFHKDQILSQNKENILKSPLIPKDIHPILSDPQISVGYFYQKRVYSLALYFVYQERRCYDTLLDSCVVKINYLIHSFTKSKAMIQRMHDDTISLNAYKDFSNYILKLDTKHFDTQSLQSNCLKWSQKLNNIMLDIDKLREATSKLKTRYESAFRRVSNLSNDYCDIYSKDKENELVTCFVNALKIYQDFKLKHKEKKLISFESVVDVIYECLGSRKKLLKNIDFHKYMQQINDIKKEFDQILVVISHAQDHIKKYKNELCQLQVERQEEIWQHVTSPSSSSTTSSSTTNPTDESTITNSHVLNRPLKFITGNTKLAEVTNMPSVTMNSMNFVIKNDTQFDLSTLSSEVVGIVNDNKSLLHQLEHKTNDSLLHIEKIKKDFNFDFTNEDKL